jgi:ammonium transporter Rh
VKKKTCDFVSRKDGSSIVGAYFGLAVAFVLYRPQVLDSPHEKSRYTSDMFAMIGTLFLFCFWPSFNAGVGTGVDRLRAVVNTYISICASVIGAFLMSSVVKKGKFEMTHIQNATLAGGVAVGTVAGANLGLHGAMVIGTLAGMISVLGFRFIFPLLRKIRLHDTCGVHYLHGIPGLMSGITGIVVASIGDRSGFLNHLTDHCLSGGRSRDSSTQSAFQAAALGLTLGMAIVGGLITGAIMRIPIFAQKEHDYEDDAHWHLPDEIEAAQPEKLSPIHYARTNF